MINVSIRWREERVEVVFIGQRVGRGVVCLRIFFFVDVAMLA